MSVTPEGMRNRANLRIRTDREDGFVTAEIYFVVDGRKIERTIQVATISVVAIDLDRSIYEDFVALAKKAMRIFLTDLSAETGLKFEDKIHRGKPKDMN